MHQKQYPKIGVPFFLFGVVLAGTVSGCQQQSENAANSSAVQEPPIVSTEPAPNDKAPAESAVTEVAAVAEPDNHEHKGHGKMGPGPGGGRGRGPGAMGKGPGRKAGMQEDMTTLHTMFDSRDKIIRTVNNTPDGAEATTESDDETIVGLIQEHVPAMEGRVIDNKPLPPMTFHPIFVELIRHSDDYTLEYEETNRGMKVTYRAKDPFVVMLVQEHAKLVSRFIKNGMEEIHKSYTLPDLEEQQKTPSESTTDQASE